MDEFLFQTPTNEEQVSTTLSEKRVGDIASNNGTTSSFDCNICLDFAQDPVVTLCGHLYCWPCMYRWLLLQSATRSHHQQCPVCKSTLSLSSLVPLYGQGKASTRSNPNKLRIPPRPSHSPSFSATLRSHHPPPVNRPYHRLTADYISPSGSFEGATSRALHQTVGTVGWMAMAMLPWVLRNPSPSWTAAQEEDSRWARRRKVQAERSLNRISMFLFCFVVLCLFLF